MSQKMNLNRDYDVNDRVALGVLGRALGYYVKPYKSSTSLNWLRSMGLVREGQDAAYFSYGRNGLNVLFREKFANSEIIFPAFISPSIILAAVDAGVKPLFVDAGLEDFNMDFDLISDEELERASAILINHTFGVPANMDRMRERIREHNLYVIEDVAQALFAKYRGEYVGGLGDAVLLSMYKQTPNLHGAILLSNPKIPEPTKSDIKLSDLVRMSYLVLGPHTYLIDLLRRWKKPPSRLDSLGEKGLPSNLSLSIFNASLSGLKESIDQKRIVAKYYLERAQKSEYLIPQKFAKESEPSWFNFSVRLIPELSRVRDRLFLSLRRKGIFCGRLWYNSPAVLDTFKEYHQGNYPNATLLSRSIINLPIKASYTGEDADYLFDTIEETVSKL